MKKFIKITLILFITLLLLYVLISSTQTGQYMLGTMSSIRMFIEPSVLILLVLSAFSLYGIHKIRKKL